MSCHPKSSTIKRIILGLSFFWCKHETSKRVTNKTSFFNSYFIKLSGNENLKNNIVLGRSGDDIKKEWKEGIDTFEKLRKKYFLY